MIYLSPLMDYCHDQPGWKIVSWQENRTVALSA
jgi:hypothetical protein